MEKISVVLVDGNEDFRGLLQEYMERDGAFTVLASVGDGMEALRAVRRLQPDLVVMDVVLPGLDGFGLLSEITQEPRAPHVLILSAWMQEENQYEALRRGADCFLPKPCDFCIPDAEPSQYGQTHFLGFGGEAAGSGGVCAENAAGHWDTAAKA